MGDMDSKEETYVFSWSPRAYLRVLQLRDYGGGGPGDPEDADEWRSEHFRLGHLG